MVGRSVRDNEASALRRLSRYHTAIFLHHQYPHRRLEGWRRPVLPLAPPGRQGVVVRDLHHGRLIDRGGDGRRYRGCHHGCHLLP
jgi:hypothetical protein